MSAHLIQGEHWAVLVAGSNGWYNYRHQADVCHAYKVLHNHGIPDERIIVMMYDDIANNTHNPTPGIIINHPNGTDVYSGVPKDYTGKDVTPEIFLKVLMGDAEGLKGIGSGRVLNSTEKDNVFVYFTDHGAPGLIAFPEEELHAKALMKTIMAMYNAKRYKEMVLYIEACESGSMFHNLLPKNISVYAITAANSKESSYACYFDKIRKTYLGDLFSVKWMEDSDAENLKVETIHLQFKYVKAATNLSHVKQFGDKHISHNKVAEFQGAMQLKPRISMPNVPLNAVPSEDVHLAILHHRLEDETSEVERDIIKQEIYEITHKQSFIKQTFKNIVQAAGINDANPFIREHLELTNYGCYEKAVYHVKKYCFDFKIDYVLRNLYILVNLCEKGLNSEIITNAIKSVCN